MVYLHTELKKNVKVFKRYKKIKKQWKSLSGLYLLKKGEDCYIRSISGYSFTH